MATPDAGPKSVDASLKSIQRILREAHGLTVEDLEYVIGRLKAIIESKEATEERQALVRDLASS